MLESEAFCELETNAVPCQQRVDMVSRSRGCIIAMLILSNLDSFVGGLLEKRKVLKV
jgi:hypothetical protein